MPFPSPPRPSWKTYRVIIHFREPTYELYTRPRPGGYVWSQDVRTTSEADAVRQAKAAFRELARLSSVAWIREIVSTEVRVLDV